jgi:hypothetical protein
MSEQAPAFEVPADVAYAAAEERAVRTTKALILSEATTLTLERRVAALEAELERTRREQRGGVRHDGATDTPEGAPAGGEVGTPHPFHD